MVHVNLRELERERIQSSVKDIDSRYSDLFTFLYMAVRKAKVLKNDKGQYDATHLWSFMNIHGGTRFLEKLEGRLNAPKLNTAQKMGSEGIGPKSAQALIFISAEAQGFIGSGDETLCDLTKWLQHYAWYSNKIKEKLPTIFLKFPDEYKSLLCSIDQNISDERGETSRTPVEIEAGGAEEADHQIEVFMYRPSDGDIMKVSNVPIQHDIPLEFVNRILLFSSDSFYKRNNPEACVDIIIPLKLISIYDISIFSEYETIPSRDRDYGNDSMNGIGIADAFGWLEVFFPIVKEMDNLVSPVTEIVVVHNKEIDRCNNLLGGVFADIVF
ncbi:MAG: hypothetical protein ACI9SP_000735 [Arenicella sp.]|jgi:hypothetical protein